MKRTLISLLAAAALFASCSPEQGKDNKLQKVFIDPEEVELLEGGTKTLEIVTEPANFPYNSVSWSSSDKEVATISRRGVLTAVAPGNATITADVDGFTASCEVTVKQNITPVSGVSLDQKEVTLQIGQTATLVATVAPEAAADKSITWSTSDEGVATVVDGFITAVNKGECDITVKTNDGGFEDMCHVTVSAPASVYSTDMPNADWSKNGYPVFNKACDRAYFYGLKNDNTLRTLYELNLKTHQIGWSINLTNEEKGWSNNGGDICVNPMTGDIICCNQCEIFCIKDNGEKRWTIGAEVTGLASTNGGGAIQGCGPAMNNDCSVIFACVNKKLLAINASDGTVLSTLDGMTGNFQFIVYGNDQIVFMKNATTDGIGFVSYANGAFTEPSFVNSPVAKSADITSGAMTRDQKKAFFCAEAFTVCVDVENKTVAYENRPTVLGKGYRWSPCITTDGYLVMGIQNLNSTTGIIALNTAEPIEDEDNGIILGSYPIDNNSLNFEGLATDANGNVYAFINDHKGVVSEETTGGYLLRFNKSGNSYDQSILATVPNVASGTYQGCFNFGGNYIVAVAGNPGKIYMFELEATRAKGWSGVGGDPQATKNANLVYAE